MSAETIARAQRAEIILRLEELLAEVRRLQGKTPSDCQPKECINHPLLCGNGCDCRPSQPPTGTPAAARAASPLTDARRGKVSEGSTAKDSTH